MKKYIIVIIVLIGSCLGYMCGQQKQVSQDWTPTLHDTTLTPYNAVDSMLENSLVFSMPPDSLLRDTFVLTQIVITLDSLKKAHRQLLEANHQIQKQIETNRLAETDQNEDFEFFQFSFLVLSILGVSIILYFFLYRYFENMDEYQDFPTNDVAEEEQTNITTDSPPVTDEPLKEETEMTPFIANDKAYFFTEIMLTAGPRKNFNEQPAEGDFGVGEDVAGLICKKEWVYFWVLDGTSDSEKIKVLHPKRPNEQIELFSSRLLAQTIAWNIQQVLRQPEAAAINPKYILHTAIAETRQEWQEKIEQLSVSSQLSLRELLRQRKNMQCSTTVLFGKLSIKGELEVCQIGDSSILTHPPLQQEIQSRDRQFALLSLGQYDDIVLKFNKTQSHNIKQDPVHTVLAMTDGISYHTQNWLKGLTSIDFSHPHIRKILAQQRPNTQDDKAICIVQIKT